MKKNYLFLSTGFEEVEALAVVDVLRRADISVQTVSMERGLDVVSSHGVRVESDIFFSDVDWEYADWLILPGGSVRLNEFEDLKCRLVSHYNGGGHLAAICAAPMVLGGLGLLEGKRATCFPGFEQYLLGAELIEESVVVDGQIVTARGAGVALDFALEIVSQINGAEYSFALARTMQIG